MSPSGLPEDWVRIQCYMPEMIRWKLRSRVDAQSDSRRVLKVLSACLTLSESEMDSLME